MKTEEKASVPEPARGHDVFVSYSRADRERVIALTQGLAERGKRAWVDLEDIPPSAEWMGEIRAAIEAADGYLVVVSPALAGSKVCAEELEHAREAGKRIVPVLVRATDPDSVPQTLAALNWIDATGPDLDPALDRIVTALETDLEHTKGHTRLLVRASEWEHKGEDRSLLLRGSDLSRPRRFLVQAQGKEPAPTPVQARYHPGLAAGDLAQAACADLRREPGPGGGARVERRRDRAAERGGRSADRGPGCAGRSREAGADRELPDAGRSGACAHGSGSRSRDPPQLRGLPDVADSAGPRRVAYRRPTLAHDRADPRRRGLGGVRAGRKEGRGLQPRRRPDRVGRRRRTGSRSGPRTLGVWSVNPSPLGPGACSRSTSRPTGTRSLRPAQMGRSRSGILERVRRPRHVSRSTDPCPPSRSVPTESSSRWGRAMAESAWRMPTTATRSRVLSCSSPARGSRASPASRSRQQRGALPSGSRPAISCWSMPSTLTEARAFELDAWRSGVRSSVRTAERSRPGP